MLRARMYLLITFCILPSVGCATLPLAEKPEVKAINPRITGIDFSGLDMAFDVSVNNPYPLPIRTPRFRYGIDIDGTRFFDSEATAQIDLPASGVGAITLPVRLSYTDMLRTYRNLRGAPEADYTLRGTLILPLLGRSVELPVSHSGTFPVLRPPTFSDINVDLGRVSLLKTAVNVNANMKNPNVFPLGIENIGYALTLGDVVLGGLTATTAGWLDAGQTGRLSLTGELSAASAIIGMVRGGDLGKAKIVPSGSMQTPYGAVKFGQGSSR